MKKKDILTIVAGVFVLIFMILIALFAYPEKKEAGGIMVVTDKEKYQIGEDLKVRIENQLEELVCFSSCYPYYIQKKDGNWKNYRYVDCPKEDVIEKCVEPNQVKAFELTLPPVKQGLHRLAISACVGCYFNGKFRETQKSFSNPFIVKQSDTD